MKNRKSSIGTQRYYCRKMGCGKTFHWKHRYHACTHCIKDRIVDMVSMDAVFAIRQPFVCSPISVEADERWSFVGKKSNQRWLWVVFGHHTKNIIAYCFGPRTDAVLQKILKLLKSLHIVH